MVSRSQNFSTYFFFIVFFVYIISFSCSVHHCHGSDRILRGQSLSGNRTLVSKGGRFELGFFTPGNSRNYYVGIWYKKIPIQTVVWVANRNNSISHSSNNDWRLQLSRNGNLQIVVLSEIIWNVETSNGTEAVILDSGNFVVRNATGSDIWQSFDHPTDTWLPSGKLEYNEFDGSSIELVSWRNQNDPSKGNYSLTGAGVLLIYLNDYEMVWSSAIRPLGDSISISNDLYSSNYFNLTHFDNSGPAAGLFYYDTFNESMYSRIVIDSFGKLNYLAWSETIKKWEALWVQPSDSCTTSGFCGGNAVCESHPFPNCSCLTGFYPEDQGNWDQGIFSDGCHRGLIPMCAHKENFEKFPNVVLPANAMFLNVKEFKKCENECRANCSCVAFAYSKELGCLVFGGDLLGITRLGNNSAQTDLYIRMGTQSSRGLSRTGLVLVVLAGATILVAIFLWYFWRKHTNKASQPQPEAHQNLLLLDLNSDGSENNNNSVGEEKDNKYELPTFSFSSIAAATNDFSITHKLGEGGFGPVYKGELLNGHFVAVKRLSKRSGQGLEEFKNETELIAKLQHRNLVGILGCCIENDEKILVYEYMPNKSLDFFLFDTARKELLDWEGRVHIIEGIAQGLQYLHHYSRLRIVHRDLKVSNILLDAEMNPKISDFGMARIFGGSDLQASTRRIVGTYGYMSPEYVMEGVFSIKSDVYAFGVLLLEIISGRKNTGFYGSDNLNLLGYAWNLWTNNGGLELVDPVLKIHSSLISIALRYIQIGLLCVQENPGERPVMSDVVAMLNKEQIPVALPQNPGFRVGRSSLVKASPQQNEVQMCSVNDLTVSLIEPR